MGRLTITSFSSHLSAYLQPLHVSSSSIYTTSSSSHLIITSTPPHYLHHHLIISSHLIIPNTGNPFDVLKTRMMATASLKPPSLGEAAAELYKSQGSYESMIKYVCVSVSVCVGERERENGCIWIDYSAGSAMNALIVHVHHHRSLSICCLFIRYRRLLSWSGCQCDESHGKSEV